jgi:hypothetical protein
VIHILNTEIRTVSITNRHKLERFITFDTYSPSNWLTIVSIVISVQNKEE